MARPEELHPSEHRGEMVWFKTLCGERLWARNLERQDVETREMLDPQSSDAFGHAQGLTRERSNILHRDSGSVLDARDQRERAKAGSRDSPLHFGCPRACLS